MLNWEYNVEITPEEFIMRLKPLVCNPVSTLMEHDGDMWLSDYSQLVDAFWKLNNAVQKIQKEEENGEEK
jgi:hypothetical protein|tara:strand:- start:1874 stop:2083 length:210 start_codon:yes stop_codon:yes gene_type:complete